MFTHSENWKSVLKGKTILVTGGTGSFGKKFVEIVLKKYPEIKKIIVYSRDELKQFEMAQIFSETAYPQIRYFIGDVRDSARLTRACEEVDFIVHAAALKQVPTAEYNPMECINTNVYGAENVIKAAFDCGVKRVVALSTDKAAAPINLYGATKLCSDKLFTAANNMKGKRDLLFSVVRYGNVLGSRGSVIPFFLSKRAEGVLPITHPEMTRFSILLEEGVAMVLHALANSWGGEIFVPKIPSYRILDLAEAIAPGCAKTIVGIRPGEKLHEEMITENDSFNTYDCGKYFVIAPSMPIWTPEKFSAHFKAEKVQQGFRYNSGTNVEWLSTDVLKEMIKTHVGADAIP
jgi:UDP-N-acetylglucosamine 4,6-dehydratase (inverting)